MAYDSGYSTCKIQLLLTLSAHVCEGYNSFFAIHSFTLSIADLEDGGLFFCLERIGTQTRGRFKF